MLKENINNTYANNSKTLKIGSICCGAGGFDTGAHEVGFETVYAIDIMKEACESFKANYPNTNVLCQDAHTIEDFRELGYVDGLIFGPPCQGFSIANHNRFAADSRNHVYKSCLKAVQQTNSKFFVFENVKGLLSMKNDDGSSFFNMILNDFERCGQGYNLTYKLVDCSTVGVPQVNRYRIIIVGIRKDLNMKYEFAPQEYGEHPDLKPLVTLRDTIYHLRDVDQTGDYDTSGYSSQYQGRLRQKNWDEPSYCIEASGRQAKLHPGFGKMTFVEKNKWHIPDTCRKLSTLECKLIQTFPEDYIITGSLAKKYEQIGNAVPPTLAKYICKPLYDMFINNYSY